MDDLPIKKMINTLGDNLLLAGRTDRVPEKKFTPGTRPEKISRTGNFSILTLVFFIAYFIFKL